MPGVIRIPDFDFSGEYYGDILEDLLTWGRAHTPEITNEDEHELWVQMMRANALVGHLGNVNADVAALESFMVTCRLPESIRAHMRMIGYTVSAQRPASATLLARISQLFSGAGVTLIPEHALVSTPLTRSDGAAVFEADEELVTTMPTDAVGYVYDWQVATGVFTDHSAAVKAAGPLANIWTGGAPGVGDMLYVIHPDVLWNRWDFVFNTPMAGIEGVWEYPDAELEDMPPDAGTVLAPGPGLTMEVNDLLCPDGVVVDRSGATVQVTLNSTGVNETVVSTWTGATNEVATVSFLGQTAPSLDENDYTVGSVWHPFEIISDTTDLAGQLMGQDGDVQVAVPKSQTENVQRVTINSVEGWCYRFRVVSLPGPVTLPIIDTLDIDQGDTYAAWETTQGITLENELHNGTGASSQIIPLVRTPVIQETVEVEVFTGLVWNAWETVENFLNSNAASKHVTVEIDADGEATVTSGDGTNGRVFPSGANNVRVTYRYGADIDGNVGANAITVNRSGMAYLKNIANPRAATGWRAAEDADADGVAELKVAGPASLRALSRGVSADDIAYLSVYEYVNEATGTSPWTRAHGIEEGYGPKTVQNVVVAAGGGTSPAAQRNALDLWFNGDVETGDRGIIVANQQVTSVDYTPQPINITATIEGGDAAVIEGFLRAAIHPEARITPDDDSTDEIPNWRWAFGEDVPPSRIMALIHESDDDVRAVSVGVPAVPVVLAETMLPTLVGAVLNLTVLP